MVFIAGAHGLEVNVTVAGRPLREFEDEKEPWEQFKKSKYVEAPSGAEFEIEYSFDDPPRFQVAAEIDLDGVHIEYTDFQQFREHNIEMFAVSCGQYYENGRCYNQKFKFSELRISKKRKEKQTILR